MKCRITLIATLVLTSASHAYMVRAPQTPIEEFDAYLQTENITSYSKVQLLQIQNQSSDIKMLSSLLEQAQRSFIKGHLRQSGDYFQAIVQEAYKKDWLEEAQNIIFYSYLRLAQIEWKENPDAFLHSAILFSPSLKPDPSLFPPPLIQKLNEIKNSQPQLLVSLKGIFPFHEIILINGKIFLKDRIKLPYGKYRVTALSSSHQPWSQVISLSEMVQKRILTPPWAGGTCKKPSVLKNIKKENILYPNFCKWEFAFETLKEKKSLEEKTSNTRIQKNIEQGIEVSIKNLNHKKWIWVGIAITGVVIGLVILSNKDRTPSKPTVRKGFPKK